MNIKIIEIIEPLSSGWGMGFWLCTLLALAAGAGMWFFLSGKPQKWTLNIRMLLAMLSFFALLIAGGTAFFTGWRQIKKQPVIFYEEQFETAFGNTLYADVRNIKKERIQETAPFNPMIQKGEAVTFLVIRGKGDQVHMLSEQDYPIDKIAYRLNELVRK
ncbi:MAG: NRT1/PTR family MFS transporter [Bacteroidetes bacterium]|nr:NRT1/PTR family MFS transporter [Bacteroidota bacterium]